MYSTKVQGNKIKIKKWSTGTFLKPLCNCHKTQKFELSVFGIFFNEKVASYDR